MKVEKLIGPQRDTTRSAIPDTSSTQTGPRLTMRQSQIVAAIREATKRNGFAPSLREIGQAVGLTSTSAVRHHIENLAELGVLTRDPRIARSCRLVTRSRLPAPADGPPCSLCSPLGNGTEEAGTVFVLHVMVGSAVGAAALNGALLTVRSTRPGPDAPPGTDGATILGQVVAVTHPV